MNETTAARILTRGRARRRRPPTQHETIALLCIAALISQTAWVGVQIAHGDLLLLIGLPLYPIMLSGLRTNLRRSREWEQRGWRLPEADRADWTLALMLWLVQLMLWTVWAP